MWYQEKTRKNIKQANPKHSLCCSMGRIQLSFLKNPPILLQKLLCDQQLRQNRNYQQNIIAAQLYIYDIKNEIENKIGGTR